MGLKTASCVLEPVSHERKGIARSRSGRPRRRAWPKPQKRETPGRNALSWETSTRSTSPTEQSGRNGYFRKRLFPMRRTGCVWAGPSSQAPCGRGAGREGFAQRLSPGPDMPFSFQIKELTGNLSRNSPSSSLSPGSGGTDSDSSFPPTPTAERSLAVAVKDQRKAIRTLLAWVQRKTRK